MSRNFVPPKMPPRAPNATGAATAVAPPRDHRPPSRTLPKILLLATTFVVVVAGVTAVRILHKDAPRSADDDDAPPTTPAPRATPAASTTAVAPPGRYTTPLPPASEPLPAEPTLPATGEHVAIQKLFDSLGDAIAANNPAAAATHFDRARFESEIEQLGRPDGLANAKRPGNAGTLLESVPTTSPKIADLQLRRVRLRKVTWLAENEAVVVIRSAPLPNGKSRWWLRRAADGAWHWYDCEFQWDGMRLSELMTTYLPVAPTERATPWIGRIDDVRKLYLAWTGRRYAEVTRLVQATKGVDFPKPYQAARMCYLGGAALFDDHDPNAALEAFKGCHVPGHSSRLSFLLAAAALNQQRQYDRLRGALLGYADGMGPDAAAYAQQGMAYADTGDLYQAVTTLRKGLAENPGDPQCRKELARLNPDDPALRRGP